MFFVDFVLIVLVVLLAVVTWWVLRNEGDVL